MSELGSKGALKMPKKEVKAPTVQESTKPVNEVVDTEVKQVKIPSKKKVFSNDTNDGVYKIDATKVAETKETVEKEEKPLEDEVKELGVVEQEESSDSGSVIELVDDEAEKLQSQNETALDSKPVEETKEIKETKELPENIQSLVDFMEQTGGSIEDYIKINADYSSMSDEQLLKDYYKKTQPHLDAEDIAFKIEEFGYDEDLDDDKDVRRKKLQLKEEVSKAKKHLEGLKDSYYKEVKLGSKLSPEQKEAIEFYNSHKEGLKSTEASRIDFTKKTEDLFGNEFKGFEFKVGEKKYRHKVNDVSTVKEAQSDISNVLGKFFDEKSGALKDPSAYHKALYAAANADFIAEQFYNQGKAEAIKEADAKAKNIKMDGRKDYGSVIRAKGTTVTAVNGDSSAKLKMKLKPRLK